MRTSNDYVALDSVISFINSHINLAATDLERNTLIGTKIVIKNLPRVNNMTEKGNWETYVADGVMGHRAATFMCSRCHYIFPVKTPFCPNCGSYMREEE